MAEYRREIHDRAFEFGCDVVRFCDEADRRSTTTRRLLLQLLDAGTSIGANLEEASAGQTKRDFIAKVAISAKEARESLHWLRLISVTRPAMAARARPLAREADELVAVLTTILRNAQSNPNRG